jgi:aryl-alcohol dehydrogenase-like predicted oxidoreductase
MGSGMLTGKMTRARVGQLPEDDWRKHDRRFNEPALSANLALVDRLRVVGARHEATPGAVAVAWTLRNPAVDGAIAGIRSPDQVDAILRAGELELSDENLAEIEEGGSQPEVTSPTAALVAPDQHGSTRRDQEA